MPGFDRTGPLGQGSRTGRGMGYCGTGVSPGAVPIGVGRGGYPRGGGCGRAFGGGRGRGWPRGAWGMGYHAYHSGWPVYSTANEIDTLKMAADDLRSELKAIDDRLHELERADNPDLS